MEQEVAQLTVLERAWTWFVTNKRETLAGAVVIVIAGVVVAFYYVHQGEKEVTASSDLSKVMAPLMVSAGNWNESVDVFLRVASEHPGTRAAGRAILQAGAVLFTQGKYAEAQAQFERFVRENPESLFRSQARLGAAACLDAQGKTEEAVRAYKDLVEQHPNDNVVPQAKFALARIYESQNKFAEACNLLEQAAQADGGGSIGQEAGMRAQELRRELNSPAAVPGALPLTKALPDSALEVTNAR